MSIIQVNHIKAAIESRFRPFIDLTDVKPNDLENCFLTRGLSAFVVAELAGTDDQSAAAAVVDCPRDNGIDAMFFDPSEHVSYVVQSKWTKSGDGSVDVGSILKFKEGINDLLLSNLDAFGPKTQRLKPSIEAALADVRNTFVVALAYTGQQPLSDDAQRPLDDLVKVLNEDGEFVKLRVLRQRDLHAIVAQRALGEAVNLKIMLKEYGSVREPYKSYYGQVDLADIAEWGVHGQYLYAENIRGFKGSTEVNDKIIDTVRNAPQLFWYFNNGITVVASRVQPQPGGAGSNDSRVFECEGASVVNGAQTVGSIVSAVKDGAVNLQNARVLVRIIPLEQCPPSFGSDVTKAANTQNRIENKDFVAQDQEQGRLQQDLFLSSGIRYVYRSGDAPPPPAEGLSFDEAAVALACAHSDISHSVLAKREVGKLWDDIKSPPYTILFNGSTSASRMWLTVQVMRIVDAELKAFQETASGKPRLIATHGNRFILHSVFRSVPDVATMDLEQDNAQVRTLVAEVLDRLIAAWKLVLGDSAYPHSAFKNIGRCKALAKAMGSVPWTKS